jgi:hypothetical protein
VIRHVSRRSGAAWPGSALKAPGSFYFPGPVPLEDAGLFLYSGRKGGEEPFLFALTGEKADAVPIAGVTLNGEAAESGKNVSLYQDDEMDVAPGGIINSIASSEYNRVEVTGSVPNYTVAGGLAEVGANAYMNEVTVNSGAVVGTNGIPSHGSGSGIGSAFGGVAFKGDAWGNTVTLQQDAQVARHVIGGATLRGDAYENTVNNNGSVIGFDIFSNDGTTRVSIVGGWIDGRGIGGTQDGDGNAHHNEVNNHGKVNGGVVLGAVNGADTGSATYNKVINTGQVVSEAGSSEHADIIGSYVSNSGGHASHNTVYFNDGLVWDIKGGQVASGGDADDNRVVIRDGRITGDVMGGHTAAAGRHADSNTVEILGGHFQVESNGGPIPNQMIYGGKADNGSSSAVNNTLILSNTPVFVDVGITGGGTDSGTGDYFTGNTLKVHNYSGTSKLLTISNFENFDFLLPSGVQNGQTILQTENLILGNGSYSSAVTGLAIAGGGQTLQEGDDITLIDSDNTPSPNFKDSTFQMSQGADLVAGKGTDSAVQAAQAGEGAGGAGIIASFSAASGGSSRYNTGSHVDMSSLALLAGLSWGIDFTPGRLTLGAFFEYGTGSYDTYNSFSNAASVHGDGDIYHLGGGILARMDFTNTGPGRFYGETSIRAGGIHNQYNGSDLRDSSGRRADYDSSSAYYGLHLGAGYIWNITEATSLDLYGKYFWTRQEGDSVILATGDPVNFQDVDSHRLRLGGRFAYAVSQRVSPYIGAAWEHEFDGEARAETYGQAINPPSLAGDSGIGELGLTFTPSASLPLSFDVGVQGYAGKREGVTGSVQVKIEF